MPKITSNPGVTGAHSHPYSRGTQDAQPSPRARGTTSKQPAADRAGLGKLMADTGTAPKQAPALRRHNAIRRAKLPERQPAASAAATPPASTSKESAAAAKPAASAAPSASDSAAALHDKPASQAQTAPPPNAAASHAEAAPVQTGAAQTDAAAVHQTESHAPAATSATQATNATHAAHGAGSLSHTLAASDLPSAQDIHHTTDQAIAMQHAISQASQKMMIAETLNKFMQQVIEMIKNAVKQ